MDALALTASLNAVGFYERQGFERVRASVHETTGGVELDVLELRKDLDGTCPDGDRHEGGRGAVGRPHDPALSPLSVPLPGDGTG